MATLAQFEREFARAKSDRALTSKLGITLNEAHALANQSRARLGITAATSLRAALKSDAAGRRNVASGSGLRRSSANDNGRSGRSGRGTAGKGGGGGAGGG